MIWTVVMWLGMQGQVGAVLVHDAGACGQGAEVRTLELSKTTDNSDHSALYACLAAPAEHVFEIRTKQKPNGKTRVCWLITTGAPGDSCEVIKTPMYCPQSAECSEDFDVTRELWLDGKRLGIIKGLD